MPKKKKGVKKRAAKKKGELDNKTIGIIIAAVVVIIIGIIVIFSDLDKKAPEEEQTGNYEEIVDVKNCPEELYKSKINVFPRDKGDDAFPNRLNIYEKDYLENKGDYVGVCSIALDDQGHTFCTSQNTFPNYIRVQELVDGKIVRAQERWFVDITFDNTNCQQYGTIPASGLPLYSCDLIDVSCHQ